MKPEENKTPATITQLSPALRAEFDSVSDDYLISRMKESNPDLLDALTVSVDNGITSDEEIIGIACKNDATPLQMELIQRAIDALRVNKALRALNI